MKHLSLLTLSLSLLFSLNLSAQKFWKETNGPEGGLVQCLAIGKSGILWAGFQAGQFGPEHMGKGLYKSDNNGLSWQPIYPYGNRDVQSITIDTSGNIFVWILGSGIMKSTDDGLSWQPSFPGLLSNGILGSFRNNYLILGTQEGVYFSTDGGENWILNSFTGSIKFVYVDQDDDAFVLLNYDGLYKTTDYGATWSSANYGISGSVLSMVQVNNSELFAGTYYGVYASRDKGESWSLLPNSPQYVTAITSDENGDIYAGTSSSGFYFSTDYGHSWFNSNNGLKCYSSTAILKVSDEQLVLGTYGDGIYSSLDKGRNWFSSNSNIKSVNVTSFFQFNQFLFVGSEQGIIYKTSDSGNNWESIDSIYTALEIHCFTRTKNGSMFFSSNSGIFKSLDDGKTWSKITSSSALKFATYFDTLSSIDYLFAINSTGVRRSTDDGNSWYPVNNGLLSYYLEDIVVNSSGYIFIANDDNIYRSTNFGGSWEVIYTGTISIYHICLVVSANNYIYAGFDWGKIILSTDDGDSWLDRGQYLNVNRVNAITTDSLNRVFIGNWWGQIFQSNDYGMHWMDIKEGMIGGLVNNLYCSADGYIYVGAYGGSVFRSVNITFVPPKVSLYSPHSGSQNQPLELEVKWYRTISAENYLLQVALTSSFDSSSVVYESTTIDTVAIVTGLEENMRYFWRVLATNSYGPGFWSDTWNFVTLNTTGIMDPPTEIYSFNLKQNYPNPFNPSTKIKFSIPSAIANVVNQTQQVTLKVYDLLGNEVSTLVEDERSAGEYEVEFNGANLPSGIYFYKLKSGKFIETKKMILIK